MNFFLPENYKAPKSSDNYMKFQEGENKFRILSAPVMGWEDWNDKTPMRFRMEDKPKKPFDPKKPIKHFWAMIVWNYGAEQIQILHVTQAMIRNGLQALCEDKDWGVPYFYDIKVMKKGDGKDTKYTINPLPHKDIAPHIQEAFMQKRCNLDALFFNADPFSQEHDVYTDGIFEKPAENKQISDAEIKTYIQSYGPDADAFRDYLFIVSQQRKLDLPALVSQAMVDPTRIKNNFNAWKEKQKKVA